MPVPLKIDDADISTYFSCDEHDAKFYIETLGEGVWIQRCGLEWDGSNWEVAGSDPPKDQEARLKILIPIPPDPNMEITLRWQYSSSNQTYEIPSNEFGHQIDETDKVLYLYPDTMFNLFLERVSNSLSTNNFCDKYGELNTLVFEQENIALTDTEDNLNQFNISESLNLNDFVFTGDEELLIQENLMLQDDIDIGAILNIVESFSLSDSIEAGFRFVKKVFTSINWRRIL